ncbi:hypothetical protein [Curtobacterium sp. P97]|uniref:hypothetical protein n=1 Tax=Curtobacterium sp. P97 TaxID=2939562 RepID=UPI00203CA2FA|nr:hypothetical protein [Curtobacterium sp. P97]MCM3521788.1 hypothetical protein [Curtobacterium sp. P97]
MTAQFSIGPSSYPDLFGVEQVTATERIALQFLSMKVDFDQWKADQGSGDRLSANEGRRSEARCRWLWANRFVLGVVVAPPLTSRHYVSANAIDVGVTMANGRNRALTPAEFDWMHTQAELRGFTWTGRNFGEPWHIEGATRPEHFPPYPNARELVASGPNRGGAPAPTIEPSLLGEHDMILFEHAKRGQALGGAGFFHPLTPEEAPWAGAISSTHIVCVNERHFDLIKAMCTQGAIQQPDAKAIAKGVWDYGIKAENGTQPAGNRLAGSDLGRNLTTEVLGKIAKAVVAALGGKR